MVREPARLGDARHRMRETRPVFGGGQFAREHRAHRGAGCPEAACHPDGVTNPGAGAADGRVGRAEDGHRQADAIATGEVSTHDGTSAVPRRLTDAVGELLNRLGNARRNRRRNQESDRIGRHRRQVAQGRNRGPIADFLERQPFAAEMDTLDGRVSRCHQPRALRDLQDCRVVAGMLDQVAPA